MADVYHSRQSSAAYGQNDYDLLLPDSVHDSDESLPSPKVSSRRRNRIILICSLFSISSLFALSVFFIVARERQSQVVEESVVGDFASNEISPYNASRYIYGEPTESYKGT